jgi:hypothetical protein
MYDALVGSATILSLDHARPNVLNNPQLGMFLGNRGYTLAAIAKDEVLPDGCMAERSRRVEPPLQNPDAADLARYCQEIMDTDEKKRVEGFRGVAPQLGMLAVEDCRQSVAVQAREEDLLAVS